LWNSWGLKLDFIGISWGWGSMGLVIGDDLPRHQLCGLLENPPFYTFIVIVIIDCPWIWKLSLRFLMGIFNCYVELPEGLRFFVGGLFLLVLGTHIPKDN
jgi:hypothetical protein